MNIWPAPLSSSPIRGVLSIPGSKSVTNRALILAAQSLETSKIRRPLISRDTSLMLAGLKSLGLRVEEADQLWQITGGLPVDNRQSEIQVGNAGTVMRFLPPLAALGRGTFSFDGDTRSYERPLGAVIQSLRQLGVEVIDQGRGGLPFTLLKSDIGLSGGEVNIDASASSQFVSALLLIGSSTKQGLRICNTSEKIPSLPHIEMSIHMVRAAGGEIDDSTPGIWEVAPRALKPFEGVIEPDLSNAAPFLAAALVTNGEITITDWPKSTTQPGDALRDIFTLMGGEVEFTDIGLRLRGTGHILGIDIDLGDVGELTPSIAATAALAQTPSHLRGIGHLRLHETDRLHALASEINALGGRVIEHEESLEIHPSALHGGTFHTYEDHRLATAGALLGLVVPGINVENMETVGKTMPTFPAMWSELVRASQ